VDGRVKLACLLGVLVTLTPIRTGVPDSPTTALLAEADHLAWLHNWVRARPLYAKAEDLFAQAGDARNALYCKISRLRADVQGTSFTEVSDYLGRELQNPLVQNDPALKLRLLVVKGNIDLEINPPESRRDWEEVLRIAEKQGMSRWAARAGGELAILTFLEGDTSKATNMMAKAVVLAKFYGDVAAQIRYFTIIGQGFVETGRAKEGLEYMDRALGLAAKDPEISFPMLAHTGRATALVRLNRRSEAEEALNQILEIAIQTKRTDYEADIHARLGILKSQANEPRAAIGHLEQAATLARRTQVYRIEASAELQLAKLYERAGDRIKARTSASHALDAIRKVGDRFAMPEHLAVLARLEAQAGRAQMAQALYEEATDVIEGMLVNAPTLSAKSSFVAAMSEVFRGHFLLAARQPGDQGRAFQILERARGRITADSLRARSASGERAQSGGDAAHREISALQLALIRSTSDKERKRLLADLFEAEQRLNLVASGVARHGVDLRASPVPLATLQRSLRNEEFLLEYVLAEPRSFCLAVDRRSAELVPLAGKERIESEIRQHLERVKSRADAKESGRLLFEILLHPISGVQGKSSLIVVPDGSLNSLPFDTLVGSDGRYLVESHVVSLAPSGTALYLLREMQAQPSQRSALAIGGVTYERERSLVAKSILPFQKDTVRAVSDLRLSVLSRLPRTEEEARAVTAAAGRDAVLLGGDQATEAKLKSEPLDQFRILHFATHGISDSEYPDRAALILGWDPRSSEDGLLQAREISALRLNAELVVLSACETGEGRIEGQEGVASLSRAFFTAGTRSVVATHWAVDDTATLALMKSFYRHLGSGENRGSALALAKRDLLARHGEDAVPYYWGAFGIVGEAAMPLSPKN
jgi:CHAT domain-containing protein/tetratricopeptide (TPR) repeat protein